MIIDIFRGVVYFVLPALISLVVICVPALYVLRRWVKGATQTTYFLVVAFGLAGSVLGIIAGASSKSITEPLVAGLIGIISSGVAYLVSKDSAGDRDLRPALPLALVVLLLGNLTGLAVGGSYKKAYGEFERSYARRMLLYEKVDLPLCKEERQMRLQGKPFPEGYVSVSCPPG